MKILDRLGNLLKSNLNAAIDKMSDPGKEIDLLIEEMESESRRSRTSVRDQLAQEKLSQKRVDELYRGVQRWQEHAERAVQAGDDDLAKEALRRKDETDLQLQEAERSLGEQSQHVARLTDQIKQNDLKIAEIKRRKETLKARARAGKEALAKEGTPFDRFDQLVSKIEMNEHQAEAMVEMAQEDQKRGQADLQVNERFDRLLSGEKGGKDQELDDRLAQLKARLDKKDGPA